MIMIITIVVVVVVIVMKSHKKISLYLAKTVC